MEKSFENCGYCKECVRSRVLKVLGRTPDTVMECAYRHILDSYAAPYGAKRAGAPDGVTSGPPSPLGESCNSNCRWTSSGSSGKPSYDDMNFSDDHRYSVPIHRRRVKFVKRKKV